MLLISDIADFNFFPHIKNIICRRKSFYYFYFSSVVSCVPAIIFLKIFAVQWLKYQNEQRTGKSGLKMFCFRKSGKQNIQDRANIFEQAEAQ